MSCLINKKLFSITHSYLEACHYYNLHAGKAGFLKRGSNRREPSIDTAVFFEVEIC